MTSTLLIAPLAGSLVNFVNASFIVAGLLFIFALAGLSKFETSKKGNAYGILGMVIAIVATIVALVKLPGYSPVSIVLLFIPMLIGGAFGVWKAVKVEMTGMPELIAQLHSFVGLAAVLIGFNAFAEEGTGASRDLDWHLHWRSYLHGIAGGLGQALGQSRFKATDPARS